MFVSPRKAGIWGQFRTRGDSQPGGQPDSWAAEGWTRLDSSFNLGRNGGLSGPGKGRLFLTGEGSRRQWVVVGCSRRQRRKSWNTQEGNKSMPV